MKAETFGSPGQLLRAFIDWQRRLSARFDLLLPAEYRVDGNQDYLSKVLPRFLLSNARIADVGGGRHPALSLEKVRELRVVVAGLDRSRDELEAAPDGSYQELIVADICEYRGNGSYQLAICQSLLEHVKDTEQALQGIASLLASGGRAVIFVPCRNAWYARINMLLPERLKRAVLFALFPKARGRQGFPAYYNRCTPKEFIAMATLQGLVVAHVQSYYCSSYFSFFTPLHIFWRIVTLGLRRIYGDQVAETFVMVLDRPATSQSSLHEHFQVQ